MMHCYAAADARADRDLVGIGGWFVSATQCAWFAEQWNISEIRDLWPALHKPAQRYIACFETLAQLALAMTAHKVVGAKHGKFALPSASDNTASEAGCEKLWSTAEPLGTVLKMAASWSARHHVELLVTHLAGEKNTWADELSRGRTARFSTAGRKELASLCITA